MNIQVRMDHPSVAVGAPGLVHVLLTVKAPASPASKIRPQLNVAVVLDRSGSMSGDKLNYAKESVRILLDQLRPDDRFSLVTFDNEVLPLVEGSRVGDKTDIKALISQIECGGSTNLSGGWIKGIELVACEAQAGNVDAVLLLTDGQANLGIVDHAQLVAMGESVNREQGVRTSCLGLGRDFNEDLLKNIASASGGRFHYIESPDHAPEVFQEELGGLLSVVAQNVELTLDFADGVTGVTQLTGHPWKVEGATCRLILGDFHDEQVKHVLLVAQLPAMTDLTDMLLASMKMNYAEIKEGSIEIKSQKQNLIVQIVDAADCAKSGDPEVLLHIGIQHAAQARQAAVAQLDKGNVTAATKVLEEQRDQLRSMAPKSSAPDRLNAEAAELDHRARELREDQDVQGSRKFMVAECACLSRTDYSAAQSNRKRHNRPRGKV